MKQPKIFIINLKRSPERREFMQKQAERWRSDLDFIFFEAVDAKNGEHLRFSKHFSNILGRMYKGRILTDGEKACYASHFSLWQKCVELGEPIFVLEDDAILQDDFYSGVQDIAASKYAFIRLASQFNKKTYPLGGRYSICFDKVGLGLGYYITPEGAQTLIRRSTIWFCPVDDYMDVSYFTKLPNVLYQPFIIESSDGDSTIAASRTKNSSPFWKAAREAVRILRFIYKQLYLLKNKKRLLRELACQS